MIGVRGVTGVNDDESHVARNPHETVMSRTGWYPGLSEILCEGLGFGCPTPDSLERAPDQKRQRSVQQGREGLRHTTLLGG